jgi:hypothetical protein
MLYARLNDDGTAFEPQRNLMTSTTHLDGGGSVAADAEGHVYVVWHGHRKTGPQEEIDRAVFVAFSNDDGSHFTPERQVNPAETGVCGCCGLKAFTDAQGTLGIVYRSANVMGNRDSVLLISTNQGSAFSATVLGQWHVSTCPMSTPALTPSGAGLLAMWETSGQIFFAPAVENSAKPLRARQAEGSPGNRKHPTAATLGHKGSPTLLAWTEGTGWEKGGALAWECVDEQGTELTSGRIDGVPVWSFAAALALPDGGFALIY